MRLESGSMTASFFLFIICLGVIGKVKLCPKMEAMEEGGLFSFEIIYMTKVL